MKHKNVYRIALALAVATTSVWAADENSAEMAALNTRLDALEQAKAQPNWTNKIKLKGDFRYRYEYKEKDGVTDKNRHRLRARLGAYADVNDQVKAGIRIASGSDESPTSTNQTLGDYSNKKEIWIDLAYLTYSPAAVDGLSATFGKMKQPWESVSDLIFDTDVNPEGISASYETAVNQISLMSHFGYHIMDEKTGDDVELISAQIASIAKVADSIKLTAGVGMFFYNNIEGSASPFPAKDKNSLTAGNYTYGYEIVDGFAKIDFEAGDVKLNLFGELLNNTASGVSENTAWIIGGGAKYKKLSLAYNYRDLEKDAILDYLDDGDFGGPGGKGHKIKAKYKLLKNWSAGVTYFRVENGSTDIDLLQTDLAVKF